MRYRVVIPALAVVAGVDRRAVAVDEVHPAPEQLIMPAWARARGQLGVQLEPKVLRRPRAVDCFQTSALTPRYVL